MKRYHSFGERLLGREFFSRVARIFGGLLLLFRFLLRDAGVKAEMRNSSEFAYAIRSNVIIGPRCLRLARQRRSLLLPVRSTVRRRTRERERKCSTNSHILITERRIKLIRRRYWIDAPRCDPLFVCPDSIDCRFQHYPTF